MALGVLSVATGVLSIGKKLFGGKRRYDSCGDQQRVVADTFRTYLSPSDLNTIADDHLRTVRGELTGRTPYALAFHYLGGDDCQVTTAEGKAWAARVDQLVSRRQAEKTARTQGDITPVLGVSGASGSSLVPSGINIPTVATIVGLVLVALYFIIPGGK